MKVIRGRHNLANKYRGNVVSIGNFDGVHLGHQTLIKRLKVLSQQHVLPSCVVTFEPHPLEYFAGAEAPPRVMSFRQKAELLGELGVNRLLCLRFNQALASTTAEEFVEEILVDGLRARHILVGDDFRFGKDRAGDFDYLVRSGKASGFTVENTQTLRVNDERVSSSRIRVCLAKGDLATAHRLLGRPWQVAGKVIHGDKRGRDFGFPTINLLPSWHRPPVTGIFAVSVVGLGDKPLSGAGYIGRRPILDDHRLVVEVHLLDFDAVVYGKKVIVNFHAKIRDDCHFDSIDALKAQMSDDIATTRSILADVIPEQQR